MSGFHETPRFPEDISYGSAGGPSWRTAVTELTSGHEERVSLWAGGRNEYNISYGVKTIAQMAVLQSYMRARVGAAYGFRYKDWLDFTSHPTNPGYTGTKGTSDQNIGAGDGTTTTFQLTKTYTSGLNTVTRKIRKPVSGSVQIWVNAVLKTEGVDYTVNTTTGVVTFTVAPTAGHAIDASFEFDVPVRLGSNEQVVAGIDGYDIANLPDIVLVEILDEEGSYTGDFFHGGSSERTISANISITPGDAYLHTISATTTGLSVTLPNPAGYQDGRPLLEIVNGGANSFAVKRHTGATLITLTSGQSAQLLISKTNSGGTKVWLAS